MFRSGKQYIKKIFFFVLKSGIALYFDGCSGGLQLCTINDINSLFRALAYMDTKKELSPVEDRGLIVLVFNTPEGSSIEYTNNNSFVLEDLLAGVDESDKYFVIAGARLLTKSRIFSPIAMGKS